MGDLIGGLIAFGLAAEAYIAGHVWWGILFSLLCVACVVLGIIGRRFGGGA